ncbi:MAG: transcription-repair coupling factor [Candidatus Onthomorpha sp.]|nr:transcription-repair coupling factor [Bacteroidales bacterium]MDD7485416.1 transcription-repair coupling factor [Bacteroidales bacterium]MDY5699416.1 transcription-repair coupling factor [Candidatus Onthomorpha sp.]
MKELIERFANSENVNSFAKELLLPNRNLALCGLKASSLSLFATGCINKTKDRVHLFLFADKQRAVYFYNDLELFFDTTDTPQEDKDIVFYPASYTHQDDVSSIQNANVVLRNMALQKLISHKARVIVSYPQAVSEKVVASRTLHSKMISVRTGDTLDIDEFIDKLDDYGFERVSQVYDAGQFSLRGGIIDVYSFASQQPFRIEVFGDQVDSIRTFDIASQLSIEIKDQITILADNSSTQTLTEKVALTDYLPQDTIIWVEERKRCTAEFASAEQLNKEHEAIFASSEQMEALLTQNTNVDILHSETAYPERYSYILSLECEGQMQFNSSFDLLIKELEKWFEQSYTCFIGVNDRKQQDRIEKIIDEFKPKDHILNLHFIRAGFQGGFIDHSTKTLLFTDHQIFNRFHASRLDDNSSQRERLTMEDLMTLKPGDYVTHIDYGVGKFGGLEKINNNGRVQETIRLVYKDNDILYVSIHALHKVSRYCGKEGIEPKLNRLGSTAWQKLKNKTKSKVKDIAKELIALYAKRKMSKGFAFSPDSYLQNELEASFLYEDTPDQYKATRDVKHDMESSCPMDRLVCGDVGFGKTEVAIRAAFKAACDGKQVAVLVPTTILAFQHYKSFSERLEHFACKVDYLNRFRTRKEIKEILKDLESGKIDVLIGTHRILSKDVHFKDLGLLIIDEEHKFGVSVKEKLKTLKVNIDTLTLTATPIPRTLQFSLMGARDLSVINTPPANRQPVNTEIIPFNREKIRDVIMFELSRSGQVYFVHNRVQNIEEVAELIRQLVPMARVVAAHGQMKGEELEEIMMDFIEGEFDVLVSTTIVENGLDIPNANTIIINQAQNYGLSDLHQLRGRVGRSNKKAFCYLIAPDECVLSDEAAKRLRAIEEFSAIGSGFAIAMRDLDIRGAGNILGAEQSGFITEIGFDAYQKILNEAMHELKTTEFKELFSDQVTKDGSYVENCTIETDLEIFIPDTYISDIVERLKVYKRLDNMEEDIEVEKLKSELADRFGRVPKQTSELFEVVKLRRLAKKLAIEKLSLKRGKLTACFISDQQSEFYSSELFGRLLHYVQCYPRLCALQQSDDKLSLTIDQVGNVYSAVKIFQTIIQQG